ncbi:hypothetical protein PSP6_310082 [Paraburkholderia tropica]|nr:hypothetical protein PSP6_310082 [Paraburkholderia tropica]
MRRAVRADEARAVDREDHRQVLQRHVVDQLVVAALQEGRVDRDHRLEALGCETARERHRVLLGDADVEVTVREALLELDHARALAHGRRDADDAAVQLGRIAQPFAEHLRVGLLGGRGRRLDAFGRVELAGTVVQDRVGFGELVALAFLRHHVQELRAAQFLDVLQRGDQRVEVVTVDRADVVEAEFFEQRGRHDHALRVLFELAGEIEHRRRVTQHALHARASGGVEAARHQAREMAIERAHRRRNRHVVVVEDDEQRHVVFDARVVHRLEGHAGRHRAVTDHGDARGVFALELARDGHAERRRNRRARVRGAEGVVVGFVAFREARNAAELTQRRHLVAAARENLVRVGLMAHVPDDAVARRVEHVMKRDRQFDRTKVGRQVAARLRDAVENEGTQFVGKRLQLAAIKAAQIRRVVNGFQQVVHRRSIVGNRALPHFCRALLPVHARGRVGAIS